jgi:hypothetical protein
LLRVLLRALLVALIGGSAHLCGVLALCASVLIGRQRVLELLLLTLVQHVGNLRNVRADGPDAFRDQSIDSHSYFTGLLK